MIFRKSTSVNEIGMEIFIYSINKQLRAIVARDENKKKSEPHTITGSEDPFQYALGVVQRKRSFIFQFVYDNNFFHVIGSALFDKK